jgi:NAD(P)-dependent dehydrogenase (short-subunit alcohol dehydrogenase family)
MTMLSDSRILVAGGTGHIGRHLVDAVLAAGGTAIVPSRSAKKLDGLSQGRAEYRGRIVPLNGNISDERQAARMLERVRPIHGAVASLGGFARATRVLDAPLADLQRVFEGFVAAHLTVARSVIPALEPVAGGYVTINGPLAFEPRTPSAGLVSVAAAAQAMLARVLMEELTGSQVRVNEVIYSSFGWGHDERNAVTGAHLGRYVAYLLSNQGAHVRGQTIHLRSPDQMTRIA